MARQGRPAMNKKQYWLYTIQCTILGVPFTLENDATLPARVYKNATCMCATPCSSTSDRVADPIHTFRVRVVVGSAEGDFKRAEGAQHLGYFVPSVTGAQIPAAPATAAAGEAAPLAARRTRVRARCSRRTRSGVGVMAAPPPSKKALAAKLHNAAEKGAWKKEAGKREAGKETEKREAGKKEAWKRGGSAWHIPLVPLGRRACRPHCRVNGTCMHACMHACVHAEALAAPPAFPPPLPACTSAGTLPPPLFHPTLPVTPLPVTLNVSALQACQHGRV
eukprot:316332-Chlamydomonas_euryale.AAC.2